MRLMFGAKNQVSFTVSSYNGRCGKESWPLTMLNAQNLSCKIIQAP